jgi:hypothetical protein
MNLPQDTSVASSNMVRVARVGISLKSSDQRLALQIRAAQVHQSEAGGGTPTKPVSDLTKRGRRGWEKA